MIWDGSIVDIIVWILKLEVYIYFPKHFFNLYFVLGIKYLATEYLWDTWNNQFYPFFWGGKKDTGKKKNLEADNQIIILFLSFCVSAEMVLLAKALNQSNQPNTQV